MTSIGWLADDPVLKQLHTVIQCGWPERKSDVPMCLRPYFDLREELVVQGSAAPDELSMSYTSANVGVSFKTKLYPLHGDVRQENRKIHLLCPLLCSQLILDDCREKEGR